MLSMPGGWSARRIARELGLHRETVGRELRISKPAKVAAGSRSLCEPHREIVTAALVQGLSAKRIHQDLVADHAFTGRYNTVKRFVHALSDAAPLPFRRIETTPGEEMQVDLGQGAPMIAEGSFVKLPRLVRSLWLTLELGGDLLTTRQQQALIARFRAHARRTAHAPTASAQKLSARRAPARRWLAAQDAQPVLARSARLPNPPA